MAIQDQNNQPPNLLKDNQEDFIEEVINDDGQVLDTDDGISLEEKPEDTLITTTDTIDDEEVAFLRPPKKPTYIGKADEDLTKEELRLKQQEELKPEIKKDFIVEEDTGNIVFKDFTDEEILQVNTFTENLGISNVDGTQTKALQKIFQEIDGQTGANGFSDLVNSVFKKQLDEIESSEKVSIDVMLNKAGQLGRNDVYLHILKKKPPYDNTMLLRGILETKLLYTRLTSLANEAIKAKGALSQEKQLQFYQTLRLFGSLYSRTAGDITQSARKLSTLKYIDKPSTEFSEDFVSYLEKFTNLGNQEEFMQIASDFLTLKPYQAGKFAHEGFFKRATDAWTEIWVNSLLSSPITHIVNMSANLGFNVLRIGEQGIAAGLNKIPGLSSPDGVQFNEVLAQIYAIRDGHRLGVANMKHGFKTGDTATTKLDLRRPNAMGKRLLPEKYRDNFVGDSLELMGSYFRLPGRFLVGEDEYAKGVLYKMEINRIAQRNYNQVIKNGGTKEAAEETYIKTVTSPNNDTVTKAKQAMEEGTFQADLPDGFLKKMQSTVNHPAMRVFVPFYKTITNIYLEASRRNPMMAAFMPSVRKDLLGENGPAARQLALAKLGTGGVMMYTFGQYAYGGMIGDNQDIFITGHAPYNRAERETFFRKGYQPYSFMIKQKDGKYKAISYARFDPISAVLAMAADTAYAMSRPDQFADGENEASMLRLAASSMTAVFSYITDQPFMTAISDIGKVLESGNRGDPEGMLTRILAQLTEQVGRATVGVVMEGGPTGTFNNYLTKMQDPTIYDTLFTEEQRENAKKNIFFSVFMDEDAYDIPEPIRKFYEVYNNAAVRSPFYNPDLKPRLNLWGENMEGPEGGVVSPVKIMNERYNRVDDVLLQLELGISMPKSKIGGVALSQDQYYDYIKLINDDSKEMGNQTMLEEMEQEIDSKGFDDLLPKEKISELNAILAERKSIAKDLLFDMYPRLKLRIDEINEQIRLRGRR